MRNTRVLSPLAAVLAVAGCAVGPDYQVPEADVADEWSLVDHPALSGDAVDPRQWWEIFEDPVLDDLVTRAYADNLSLKTVGMRILQARAARGISVGNFFPQQQELFGNAQHVNTTENSGPDTAVVLPPGVAPPGSPRVGIDVDQSFSDYSGGGQIGWELDFWGRFRRAIEASDAELEAAYLSYDDTAVLLISEVASAYVALRTLEAQREVAVRNVEVQQQGYDIALAQFQAGATSELDSNQGLVQLRNTQASIPLFDAAIRQTKNGIAILLGMPPSDLSEILGEGGLIPDAPEKVAVGAPADLLRRRPDVRAAERLAAAQCARIGIAEADYYPSFSLFGSLGYASNHSGNFWHDENVNGAYGGGFSWKILNYGRIANNVRLQDARFQESIFSYQNSVLQAAGEVENAGIAFVKDKERTPLLEESVQAALKSVQVSTAQYRQGAVQFTRVLDSQAFQFAQETQLVSNRGQVIQDLISLYRALGGGWEARQGDPFVDAETAREMSERTNWGEMLTPANGAWSDALFPPPAEPRVEPADDEAPAGEPVPENGDVEPPSSTSE